jgi:hypothetical protein
LDSALCDASTSLEKRTYLAQSFLCATEKQWSQTLFGQANLSYVFSATTSGGGAVGRLVSILSKETMAAHAECVARDFYGKHSLLLNVVVNSATIDIDDLSRTRNSNNFDVFAAPLAPNFIAVNKGWLQFDHLLYSPLGNTALPVSRVIRFLVSTPS